MNSQFLPLSQKQIYLTLKNVKQTMCEVFRYCLIDETSEKLTIPKWLKKANWHMQHNELLLNTR